MAPRIDQNDTVGIEQSWVVLDQHRQIALVGEGGPGRPVAQRIGAHGLGDVEGRAHPGPGFPVPGAAGTARIRVAGLPQADFLLVGAAVVAARDERQL